MRIIRFITPLIALSLLLTSCKDKGKQDAGHSNATTTESVGSASEATSDELEEVDVSDSSEETGEADAPTVNKSKNESKEEKFRGVESDLRDFSDDPESAKKEALKQIANYQDQLQAISFDGPSDFKKAEELARKISSLFRSFGAKDEAQRWHNNAESFRQQSKR